MSFTVLQTSYLRFYNVRSLERETIPHIDWYCCS